LNTSQTGVANQSKTIQGVGSNSGFQAMGSVQSNALGQPTAPTFTYNGTVGTTSVTYYCVGSDINGNDTVASSSASATTGNATLSATNSTNIFCPGEAGAIEFKVLKTNNSTLLGTCYTNSNVGCSVTDSGQTTTTYNSVTNGALTAGPVAQDQTNVLQNSTNGCSGSAKAVAGTVEIVAPCVTAYTLCTAQVQLGVGVTPVAGDVAACAFTSTATTTIIGTATTTITVGAVLIELAGTPSPSPTVEWFAGVR
jgi:hypothetical protein